MADGVTQDRARFADVLRVAEFRVLLTAQAQSRAGDQLARVALALLVFSQTSSAALTTLVYAMTYLPPLLTAPLLAGLADRYPRRMVMTVTDVVRAALVAMTAIPALPLVVIVVLLAAMTCLQPLFSAARGATLPAILPGDRFPVGMSIANATDFVAQIAGFTLGGVLVAVLGGPRGALLVDAGTYVISAGLVRWGIGAHRPGGERGSGRRPRFALAAIGLLRQDRRLAGLAALVWMYGFYLAPAALAAPYAHQIGAGEAVVGILTAADLPGAMAGTLLLARIPPAFRQRLTVPFALLTGLPLLAAAVVPPLPVMIALCFASGFFASYVTLAQVAFTRLVPDALRARAIGVASAGLQSAQGLGILMAGLIAQIIPPSASIAVCAAAGLVGTVLIRLADHSAHARDKRASPVSPE
jgi:Major Facilitator Superfamily